MKIAIVGAGFTGLAAALRLTQLKHQVTIFEKEKSLGGLAATFKLKDWQWSVERHYHHWFANDVYALRLIKDLGLGEKLIYPKTLTSVFYQGKIFPFNSASHVLTFSPISFPSRLRTGTISFIFKLMPKSLALDLEKYTAYSWIKKYFGEECFEILWKPLLWGKFGPPTHGYADKVNMAWFWARIKKRTLTLGYLEGGYQTLLEALALKIKENGGKILLCTPFSSDRSSSFDKVLITAPSLVFTKLYPKLPSEYKRRISSISHLSALNLLLITRQKFLKDTYWLNITDNKFPFIGVIQQTNLVDAKYYGGHHLTYVGNYLPAGHPYLKMTKEELLDLYLPYLKRINPNFNSKFLILNSKLFFDPFAQPVFPVNYSKIRPDFNTPLPHVYLANMDMVYPWDRGTNYAIELGYKAAEVMLKSG